MVKIAKSLTRINVEFLSYFEDGTPRGAKEIVALTGLNYPAAFRRLLRLEHHKCIKRVGNQKRPKPITFVITAMGKAVLRAYE